MIMTIVTANQRQSYLTNHSIRKETQSTNQSSKQIRATGTLARENTQLVPSAGKRATATKRGKQAETGAKRFVLLNGKDIHVLIARACYKLHLQCFP